MSQVYKLNIDSSDLLGALSAIEKLRESLEDVENLAKSDSKAFSDFSGKLQDALDKVNHSLDDMSSNISKVISGFSRVLSTVKSIALFTIGMGGPFMSAVGTGRELTAAGMSKLSWAGQRAYENASNFTGFSPNFQSTQEALNTGYFDGTFSPLGMGADEISELQKVGGDKAYFTMVDKFAEKLKNLTDEMGDFQGQNVFHEIYGESLSKIIGMSSSEFINGQKSGLFGKFKSSYYDTMGLYKGLDSSSLLEGEKALNKFTETLKVFGLSLASKVLPGLTKVLNGIQGVFSSFVNWLNTSKVAKNLGKIFEGLITALTKLFNVIEKVFDGKSGVSSNIVKATDHLVDVVDNFNEGNYKEAIISGGKAIEETASGMGKAATGIIQAGMEAVVGPIPEETKKANAKMFNDVGKMTSDFLEKIFGSSGEPKIQAKVDNKLTVDINVNGKSAQSVDLLGNQGRAVKLNVGSN
ncbi:TPA: hypothetical protein RTG57_001740 [Campylobacter jejuni]|nr:hypothetical protein [Campylobacter jejuni]